MFSCNQKTAYEWRIRDWSSDVCSSDLFAQLGLAPEVANKPPTRELATSVMGQPISMPVMISPTGVQAVHPDGEVAVARAAAARGTAMGLSSFASKPVEEVVEANPQTFFQIYWCGTKDHMHQRLDRAKRAGVAGLIVTLDWSFSHRSEEHTSELQSLMRISYAVFCL